MIQWRKKTKLMGSQVDISCVKFHSSHSKGTRKQFLSRKVSAQRPCNITIKALFNILTIAMCRCTIISLLLDFNFEFFILDEVFNLNIISTFHFFNERNFPFGCVICFPSRFFIELSSQTAHMQSCDFSWF